MKLLHIFKDLFLGRYQDRANDSSARVRGIKIYSGEYPVYIFTSDGFEPTTYQAMSEVPKIIYYDRDREKTYGVLDKRDYSNIVLTVGNKEFTVEQEQDLILENEHVIIMNHKTVEDRVNSGQWQLVS